MEDNKPRSNSPRPTSSAHVIDLRQSASQAPSKAPSMPPPRVRPAKARPAPPAPEARPESAKQSQPEPARQAQPPVKAPPQAISQPKFDYVDAPFAGKSRFWPAFWRFLLLLIVLGVIVVVGVYFYLNYYQSS